LGAAAAVSLVVALGVLVWPIGVLSRGDGKGGGASARSAASATGRLQLVDRAVLRPLPGNQGAGLAVVAKRGGKRQLVVQARLKPNARGQAYEVWLYNSRTDAKSLGAQVTDRQGNYQGAGPLPGDYRRYRFIDVSLEPIDQNQAHSGHSVLRGRVVHTG
jgi:hypothetical protein